MIIDFSQVPCAFDGTQFERDGKPFTLGAMVVDALLTDRSNKDGDWQAKARIFNLACKLKGESQVEVSAEDITLMKQKVGDLYPAGATGPICNLLDNPTFPQTDEVPAPTLPRKQRKSKNTESVNA